MHAAISLLVWLFCGGIVTFVFAMVVVDMAGKFDYLQQHFPQLLKWSEKRELHGLLLLICIGLLAGVGYELMTNEMPEAQLPPIIFKPPDVPSIAKVVSSAPKESRNSLRRRTIALVDELYAFSVGRNAHHPPVAVSPDPKEGPIDEDRKKAIKLYSDYLQEGENIYMTRYRERMVGIIQEYKAKGIPTGWLENQANQRAPYVALPGSGWVGSCQDELGQFRELSYHVDALDNPIHL